jgi:hypothetical protein
LINTNYNPFLFYSSSLIHIVFNTEYDLAVWNPIPSADPKELKRVQRCKNVSLLMTMSLNDDFLKFLKFHTLQERRIYLDALFLISVYFCLKCCPSVLDITGIRVLPRNFRNSFVFTVTCKNCLPRVFRLLTACKDVGISRKSIT